MPDLIDQETLPSDTVNNQRYIRTVVIENTPFHVGLVTNCHFIKVKTIGGQPFGEQIYDGRVELPFSEVSTWAEFMPFYLRLKDYLYAARRAQDVPPTPIVPPDPEPPPVDNVHS